MKYFVTRVELIGAKPADYEALHDYMARENFHRTIEDSRTGVFQLPPGTYFLRSESLDTTEVRELARKAATFTGLRHWVITTNGDSSWYLPRVDQSPS